MLYKNKRTGEIRDFACTLNGEIWEPEKAPISIEENVEKKPVKKTTKNK